jgi:hypothetical protein
MKILKTFIIKRYINKNMKTFLKENYFGEFCDQKNTLVKYATNYNSDIKSIHEGLKCICDVFEDCHRLESDLDVIFGITMHGVNASEAGVAIRNMLIGLKYD